MALSGSEMGLRYHNRVAVVTGGTKGIGEAIVRLFDIHCGFHKATSRPIIGVRRGGSSGNVGATILSQPCLISSQTPHNKVSWFTHETLEGYATLTSVKNGANVVFCSNEENAGDLEKELLESGPGTGTYVSCDVTKEDEVKRLIDVTMKTHGRVDCLINNAGWHPPEQRIDDTHAEEFLDLLKLNLIGYFLTAKYALPHLRKTQGNIINISSLVGIIGQKHAIPYVATKGAVTAMTKAMAVDESQYNVRVNSISPGNIWTPLWEELSSHSANPEAMILGGKDAQLLGRMGTAEECAKAALYLAAEGTFCTGIDLLLTGGAELNYANKNQQKTRSSIYH